MRKATLLVVAFEVECPYCLEGVEHPLTGSLTWLTSETAVTGQKVKCHTCEEVFELPKTVSGNKLPTQ